MEDNGIEITVCLQYIVANNFMLNPWLSLPQTTPYILQSDIDIVGTFNNSAGANHKLQTDYFPEPFIGSPLTAKVILLNLNPGVDEKNKLYHKTQDYLHKARQNLSAAKMRVPFIFLDKTLESLPGGIWWNKKLRQLIKDSSLERVSNEVACIELHGYPSKNFKPVMNLPSMVYSKYLVEQSILRGALIIVMRGYSYWVQLAPSLINYNNLLKVNSVQNPCITPNNLTSNGYQKILKSI